MLASCVSLKMAPKSAAMGLTTEPANLDVVVSDKDGNVVFDGQTPASFTVLRGKGLFKFARYDIRYSTESEKPTILVITSKQGGEWEVDKLLSLGSFEGIKNFQLNKNMLSETPYTLHVNFK